MYLKQSEKKTLVQDFYEELHDIIRTCESPVYRCYDDIRTYRQMYEQMISMNSFLKKYRGQRIVVFSSKSFEAYSAIYAILFSGNTWVPVDPELPVTRSLAMIKLSEPSLIITDRSLPEELQAFTEINNIQVLMMSDVTSDSEKTAFNFEETDSDALAYIMFTSGSTGVPKGVPMTHLNYIHFIRNAMDIIPFEDGEVFSDYHDFGFDISIFYIFCCILAKGSFAPAIQYNERIFPLDNLIENGVTVWSTVPSVITRFRRLRPDDRINSKIKIMFLCGEPLPVDVVDYGFINIVPDEIYNFYGLTETGVENFYHRCRPDDIERFRKKGFIPIGRPLKGNDVDIDTQSGELAIAGVQVTPGYLGGRETERFQIIEGIRWFYTGDIAEVEDGHYFLKGRVDSQIKINGYRVELMDIEANVRRIGNLREAVCLFDKNGKSEKLVCFFESDENIDQKSIKAALKKEIPAHMIPTDFRIIDEMPVNRNGKIDRKELKMLL